MREVLDRFKWVTRVVARLTEVSALPTSFTGNSALEAACKKEFESYAIDGNTEEGIVTVYQEVDYKGKDAQWFNDVGRKLSQMCLRLNLKLGAPQMEKSDKPISISFEYKVRVVNNK